MVVDEAARALGGLGAGVGIFSLAALAVQLKGVQDDIAAIKQRLGMLTAEEQAAETAISGETASIAHINAVVGQMNMALQNLQSQINALQGGVAQSEFSQFVGRVNASLQNLQQQINSLQGGTGAGVTQSQFSQFVSQVNANFERVNQALQTLQQQLPALAQRVSTLEAGFARLPPGLGGKAR